MGYYAHAINGKFHNIKHVIQWYIDCDDVQYLIASRNTIDMKMTWSAL